VDAIDYSRCAAREVSQAGRVSSAFGYTSSRLIVQSAIPARFTTAEVVRSERELEEKLSSRAQRATAVVSVGRSRRRVIVGSYRVPSRSMAHMTIANLRAKAQTAT